MVKTGIVVTSLIPNIPSNEICAAVAFVSELDFGSLEINFKNKELEHYFGATKIVYVLSAGDFRRCINLKWPNWWDRVNWQPC